MSPKSLLGIAGKKEKLGPGAEQFLLLASAFGPQFVIEKELLANKLASAAIGQLMVRGLARLEPISHESHPQKSYPPSSQEQATANDVVLCLKVTPLGKNYMLAPPVSRPTPNNFWLNLPLPTKFKIKILGVLAVVWITAKIFDQLF